MIFNKHKINIFKDEECPNIIKKNIRDMKRILKYIENEVDSELVMEVSLFFVSAKEIQRINKEFRKVDKATDVLSFPFLEDQENKHYLGDIFINYEILEEQASSIESDINTEVKFLFMHSLLHLIGYDHDNKKAEDKMTAKQREIFTTLGIRDW